MRIAVVTISDTVARGERQDASGPAVVARCQELGWPVTSTHLVADDALAIGTILRRLSDEEHMDLILTTGGTGLGPRDVTPEATAAVADKMIPGFAEQMRRKGLEKTPRAILSRSSAAIRGAALILNLPGSPKGATESLDAIVSLIPHALEIIHGARHD
jgi:molybdenum cofactor synthesis domain-containing protein